MYLTGQMRGLEKPRQAGVMVLLAVSAISDSIECIKQEVFSQKHIKQGYVLIGAGECGDQELTPCSQKCWSTTCYVSAPGDFGEHGCVGSITDCTLSNTR